MNMWILLGVLLFITVLHMCFVELTYLIQFADYKDKAIPNARGLIGESMFSTELFHSGCHCGIMMAGHIGEEMMFNLIIEESSKPICKMARSDIQSSSCLQRNPIILLILHLWHWQMLHPQVSIPISRRVGVNTYIHRSDPSKPMSFHQTHQKVETNHLHGRQPHHGENQIKPNEEKETRNNIRW